jgi:SAM-dependent methyltransferase
MNKIKMASCDIQSEVYIYPNVVYRKVKSNYRQTVIDLLNVLKTAKIEGIINAEICQPIEINNVFGENCDLLVIKHNKISYISYPNEWCPSMLKDAALFHLDLSLRLQNQELFLKDAHPWNILFEKGSPVFIDFTSIVSRSSLFNEGYLQSNKLYRDDEERLLALTKEIYERMYFPYFINALLGYAFGNHAFVLKSIEASTLNSSTSQISLRKCIVRERPWLFQLPSLFRRAIGLKKIQSKINSTLNRLDLDKELVKFYNDLHKIVAEINVEVGKTAYADYYSNKGENDAWIYSENWNDKQKGIHDALNSNYIKSVLDVACNTGWFAIMAEKLGKSVVAFDIDEGCIEILYAQVKKDRLDILPLVMNFAEMTQDRYSIIDGNRVLINASDRLRSDSVIALGIIHHLILGVGMSFNQVLDSLIPLCAKQLIIEFVDKKDAMIKGEPSFFPAYSKNPDLLDGYDIDVLIDLLQGRGFEVCCKKSYPITRSLIICNVKHP